MIKTILRVTWLELARDRVALSLTFVLPILFFSIFATVFSAMDEGGLSAVRTTIVVDPEAEFASRVAAKLIAEPRLETRTVKPAEQETALTALRRGQTSAVVILPRDLSPALGTQASAVAIEIYADRSNPLASGVIQGLVRSANAAAAVDRFVPEALITETPVVLIDALGRQGKRPSIAFFAAGLGVMFLMFAVTGRGSILLEERERGVLGRLLAARVGLVRLLVGRWLFLALLGTVQVSVMFLWAALGFGLELFTVKNLTGFLVITIATAAAAAAFGLLLASLCRTRAQLTGVAIVVILTLCAVGGNMFPSFLMPERLQAIGQLTFNAWALAAYQKVFWYERPIFELWPEVSALGAATLIFFGLAVLTAKRWSLQGMQSS